MFAYWEEAREPSRPMLNLVMSLVLCFWQFYLGKFRTNGFAADRDFSHRIEQSSGTPLTLPPLR